QAGSKKDAAMRMMLSTVLLFSSVTQVLGHSVAMPPPHCTAPEYRQLDFWLGDWDTFEPGGSASIARAHVDLIAGSCAVHELYEQTDGLIGDSILSYDPVRKLWQQTWVTNYGSLMMIAGSFKDNVLTLEGDVHLKDGRSVRQRITWRVEGDGVR